MDAADDILGLNHPFTDGEIARLRQAWIAGRDWGRQLTSSSSDRPAADGAAEGEGA